MIRQCEPAELEAIRQVVNDGAKAYRGIIPADRCKDPYMSAGELRHEIEDGVHFWGVEDNGDLVGVMGIQSVEDVTLIRHAYVRTGHQRKGIGERLLLHLRTLTPKPVLIGTWADASWAIRLYERHGFRIVQPEEKGRLLRRYWKIPERQIETSVVLADANWRTGQATS